MATFIFKTNFLCLCIKYFYIYVYIIAFIFMYKYLYFNIFINEIKENNKEKKCISCLDII